MIKKGRIKLKLTQRELAERVGICRNYLSKLENKKEVRCRAATILVKKIATELDINIYELFDYFTSNQDVF